MALISRNKTHSHWWQRTQQRWKISNSSIWKSSPSRSICLGVRVSTASASHNKARTPTMKLSELSLASTVWRTFRRPVAYIGQSDRVKAASASVNMISRRERSRSRTLSALWTFSQRSWSQTKHLLSPLAQRLELRKSKSQRRSSTDHHSWTVFSFHHQRPHNRVWVFSQFMHFLHDLALFPYTSEL